MSDLAANSPYRTPARTECKVVFGNSSVQLEKDLNKLYQEGYMYKDMSSTPEGVYVIMEKTP